MFSLSFLYLYFLFISHFGFKTGVWLSNPVHCFSISLNSYRPNCTKIYLKRHRSIRALFDLFFKAIQRSINSFNKKMLLYLRTTHTRASVILQSHQCVLVYCRDGMIMSLVVGKRFSGFPTDNFQVKNCDIFHILLKI